MANLHSRSCYLTEDKRIAFGAEPIRETKEAIVNWADVVVALVDLKTCCKDSVKTINSPVPSGRFLSKKNTLVLVERILAEYKSGKNIYIHCKGGHGRAGTLSAILIGKLLNIDAPAAIHWVEKCRETRDDISRNFIPIPETDSQVAVVFSILGGEKSIKHSRSDKSWLKRVKAERSERK